MSVINTEIDAAKIEINSLISQQNETSMILKATGSESYLNDQNILILEYYNENSITERFSMVTHFVALGNGFLNNLQSIINSPNAHTP